MNTQHIFSLVCFSILFSCRSPDKLLGDSNVFLERGDTGILDIPTDILPVSTSQLQSGSVAEGTLVLVEGVGVTTPSVETGVYVADSAGGTNSGIWLQADFENKSSFQVEIGDVIDVQGTYVEIADPSADHTGSDSTLSAIRVSSPSQVTVLNTVAFSITPVPFDPTLMSSPAYTESYEGSLVEISAPTISFDIVDDGLVVDTLLPIDDSFVSLLDTDILNLPVESIQGVMGYKNGNYVLHPRTIEDVNFGEVVTTELNEDKLYFSEVLLYEDELNFCGGFQWYLELNYDAINVGDLDLNSLYLKHVSGSDPSYAKITPGSDIAPLEILGPGTQFLISDGDLYNCLMKPNFSDFAISTRMDSVSGMSGGIPDEILPGDEIHLYYASSEADFENGVHVLIDSIEVSTENVNATLSLHPTYDGTDNDMVSISNIAWCLNGIQLYSDTYTPLYDVSGAMVMGSPGVNSDECDSVLDTGTNK